MGSFSTTVRSAWLTATLGGAAYSNSQVWVQLHLGDPGAAGTASPAANTQRKQATMAAVVSAAASNTVALQWTSVPATETYTHVSVWSVAVGGVFIGRDDLAAPAPVTSGGNFTMAIGDLALAVT